MVDSSESFADGLGLMAADSNELRRKQRAGFQAQHSSSSSSIDKLRRYTSPILMSNEEIFPSKPKVYTSTHSRLPIPDYVHGDSDLCAAAPRKSLAPSLSMTEFPPISKATHKTATSEHNWDDVSRLIATVKEDDIVPLEERISRIIDIVREVAKQKGCPPGPILSQIKQLKDICGDTQTDETDLCPAPTSPTSNHLVVENQPVMSKPNPDSHVPHQGNSTRIFSSEKYEPKPTSHDLKIQDLETVTKLIHTIEGGLELNENRETSLEDLEGDSRPALNQQSKMRDDVPNKHSNNAKKGNVWANFFKAQGPAKSMVLEHFPDQGKNASVRFDESDLDILAQNNCLLGHFLDGKMDFPLLRATAREVWSEYKIVSIRQLGACYCFEFEDEQSKLKVLEGGPYFFSCRYLVLKDWTRFMKPTAHHPSSIPVWIKIRKLPLECWTARCFSKIASAIGKPLYVDNATANKRRLDYARVCVELQADIDLLSEVTIHVDDESMAIPIEYQWLPPICKECKVFGHNCSSKVSTSSVAPKEWRVVGKGNRPTSAITPAPLNPSTSKSLHPGSANPIREVQTSNSFHLLNSEDANLITPSAHIDLVIQDGEHVHTNDLLQHSGLVGEIKDSVHKAPEQSGCMEVIKQTSPKADSPSVHNIDADNDEVLCETPVSQISPPSDGFTPSRSSMKAAKRAAKAAFQRKPHKKR